MAQLSRTSGVQCDHCCAIYETLESGNSAGVIGFGKPVEGSVKRR